MSAYCQALHTGLVTVLIAILVFGQSALAVITHIYPANNESVLFDPEHSLIYTRLRFDDQSATVLQNFQQYYAIDEKKFKIKLQNETYRNNVTKDRTVTYYENRQVDASALTHDDLVFWALDGLYKSRLNPAMIYTYDNPEDRRRSSDPSVVSDSKCSKDLSYLMTNLYNFVRLRLGTDPKGVAMSPELTSFFDATSTEEPGLLYGNNYWVNNWRQCTRREIFHLDRANESQSVFFRGRYCVASLRSPNWEDKIEQRRKDLEKSGYFKYPEQGYDYSRFFRLQVSVCVPDSCDSRLLDVNPSKSRDIHQLVTYKLPEPYKSYRLIDFYCLPDEASELRKLSFSGWLFIIVMSSWLGAIGLATYCDLSWTDEFKAKRGYVVINLVNALSFVRNCKKLFNLEHAWKDWNERGELLRGNQRAIESPETSKTTSATSSGRCGQQPQQLRSLIKAGGDTAQNVVDVKASSRKLAQSDLMFLNVFKVVFMPIQIFAHAAMMYRHMDKNGYDMNEAPEWTMHVCGSAIFGVDWFFFSTGMVTCYVCFLQKRVKTISAIEWLYTIFHRYWRLAPIYIILFWYAKSLLHLTSSGPMWDYGTNNMTLRAICQRESWIYPLALVSNWHPLHEECIMPSWYLGNDMQYYMITPLLLIMLYKSPLAGWLVTLSMLVGCWILRMHYFLTNPRVDPLELMRPRSDLYMRTSWDTHENYLYPHYRIASFLIGILAGHYAYMVMKGKWRSPLYWANEGKSMISAKSLWWKKKIRAMLNIYGWWIVLSMQLSSWQVRGLYPESLDKHVKLATAIVYSFHHTYVAIGLTLVSLTLLMGQFPWLKHWMSHPYWTLLSRINLSVFMVQVEVVYLLLQTSDSVPELTHNFVWKFYLNVIVIIYILSILMTILIDQPLTAIEAKLIRVMLLSPKRKPRDKTAAPTESSAKFQQVHSNNEESNSGQHELRIEVEHPKPTD